MTVLQLENANKYRSFPFRVDLPGVTINNGQFTISSKYTLPIYCTKVTKGVITLEDSTGTFVAALHPNQSNSVWADECSGWLEFTSTDVTYTTKSMVEFKAITYIESPIGAPVVIKETPLIKYASLAGNKVEIDVIPAFKPVCAGTPIREINGVPPNESGVIEIRSDNAGLDVEKEDNSIVKVSSVWNLTDFDKRAITAPRGDVGLSGPAGEDSTGTPTTQSIPGKYSMMHVMGLTAILYDIDVKRICSTFAVSDTYLYRLNDMPAFDMTYSTYTDIASLKGRAIVSSEVDIREYSFDDRYIKLHGISGVKFLASKEDNWVYATSNTVYDSNRNIVKTVGEIYSLTYEAACHSPAAVYTLGGSTWNSPLHKRIQASYDKYAVDIEGRIWDMTNDTFVRPVNTPLNSIHGTSTDYMVAVGDEGVIVIYDKHRWTPILKQSDKKWEDVCVTGYNNFYVAGKQL